MGAALTARLRSAGHTLATRQITPLPQQTPASRLPGNFSSAWSIWIPGTCNGCATRQNPVPDGLCDLGDDPRAGNADRRTPVAVKVLPSGLVTLNVFALTCPTTEPEP